jgi:hypothetical protein
MAPPPPAGAGASTVRRVASSVGRPSQAPERAAPRRPPLKVVPAKRGAQSGKGRSRSGLVNVLAVVLIVGALLVVVIGHAMLADGQVRMATIQQELTLEQSTHRQAELEVSQLETPARIVNGALELHMVPSATIEIPYVPTDTPLPPPDVTPAPVAAAVAVASTTPSSTTPTSTP